jgi:hypothetical protein
MAGITGIVKGAATKMRCEVCTADFSAPCFSFAFGGFHRLPPVQVIGFLKKFMYVWSRHYYR